MQSKSKILIDWLQFTILGSTDPKDIADILPLELADMELLPKGGNGYKQQLFLNNIRIYFDGNADMGVHCQISGKGCRWLESQGMNLWKFLFNLDDRKDVNITRADFALDIEQDIIPQIMDSIDNGLYTSRSQTVRILQERVKGDRKANTQTIYFGARSSNAMLRIYNKALESGLDTPLTRMEMVLRKNYIKQFVPYLRKDINKAVCSIITSYFRPVTHSCKNLAEVPTASYWKCIMKTGMQVRLYENPTQKTIEDKIQWLEHQVAPTIALLDMALCGLGWIEDMADRGKTRLKTNDYKILEVYNEQCAINGADMQGAPVGDDPQGYPLS